MIENHDLVQKYIGLSEGGYVNNKHDNGGPTDRGITQRTFDAWNRQHNKPLRSVRGISKETAEMIIAQNYFAPVKFNMLPPGLDYCQGDFSVNSGPATANKFLQRALGFKGAQVDGIVGSQTLAAVDERCKTRAGLIDLISEICHARLAWMKTLSDWKHFKNGWTTRVMGEEPGAQVRDRGVIDRATAMALGHATGSEPVRPLGREKAVPKPAPDAVSRDPSAVGTVAGATGAVTALGAVLTALKDLDAQAQTIAVTGLCVALLAALYVLRNRIKAIAGRV